MLLALPLMVASCALVSAPDCTGGCGERVVKTPTQLQHGYHALWDSLPPSSDALRDVQRVLVHQGLPTSDSLVLWYMLPDHDPDPSALRVRIREGARGAWRAAPITRHRLEGWPTGRLTVTGLRPDTAYTLQVHHRKRPLTTLHARTKPQDHDPTPDLVSFVLLSCNEPYQTRNGGILARDVVSWRQLLGRATGAQRDSARVPARPSFGVGLGDQIYVDPDAADAADAPMEALSLFRGPRTGGDADGRLIDMDDATAHLRVIYRYNLAMPLLDQTFARLPMALMWDDHEIRDGWGSQGDEDAPHWKRYFPQARAAYLAHQALRNPSIGRFAFAHDTRSDAPTRLDDTTGRDHALFEATDGFYPDAYTRFAWGRHLSVFLMDQRTQRNAARGALMSAAQWRALEQWLSDADDDEPVTLVLGSAVPMFLKRTFIGDLGDLVSPELEDDMRDGFDSRVNTPHRERLVGMLIAHFRDHPKHRLLVASGDVHTSGVLYLELETDHGKRVIGHEVIASGIAHGSDLLSQSIYNMGVTPGMFTSADPTEGAIHSSARGTIDNSPAFAEVILRDSPRGATLGVVFYPSALIDGDTTPKLVNHTPPSAAPAPPTPRLFVQPEAFTGEHTYGDAEGHAPEWFTGSIVPLRYDRVPQLHCRDDQPRPYDLTHRLSVRCIVRDSDASADLAASWDDPLPHKPCAPLPFPEAVTTTDCSSIQPSP